MWGWRYSGCCSEHRSPEIKPAALPDSGKTAKIYANLQGVISQATTLQSSDGLATVTIGEGIVAKDSIGKSLSSIAIKAIPADRDTCHPPRFCICIPGYGV